MKDYYAILGLDPEASGDSIKLAYRKLAREAHPDRRSHLGPLAQAEASARMAELNEAYSVLSSGAQRREYDEQYRGTQAGTPVEEPRPVAPAAPEPPVAPPRGRARPASQISSTVVSEYSQQLRKDLLTNRQNLPWQETRLEGFDWALEAGFLLAHYCVALRGFATADLSAAQKFTNYAHVGMQKSSHLLKKDYFLFLMPFQRFSQPEQVTALCRRFIGNSKAELSIILMDLSYGRSLPCGPRIRDARFEQLLQRIGLARP